MDDSRPSRKENVSLAMIAKEVGTSPMAVSLALRNREGVGKQLRSKILRIAERMGYQPDARVAEWMATVRASKARSPTPLAWLTMDFEKDIWHANGYHAPYFVGAQNYCRKVGYRIEEFWMREPGMSMHRISQILFNRGIRGVIVAPPTNRHVGHILLKWEHFATVSFEKGILAPRLHRVAMDYYYNLNLILKRLRRYGYRRIGLCLPEQIDRRTNHTCLACMAYFHSQIPRSERVPAMIHTYEGIAGREFHKWMAQYRPDVVVCQHSGMVLWLKELGLAVPHDIGVVHLAVEDDCTEWAGIWGNRREIGEATARLVISLIESNNLGLPTTAHDTLICGSWHDGCTLLVPNPREPASPSKQG